MASYFTATHPSSPFTSLLIVQRNTDTYRYWLRDLDLTVETPDGARHDRRLDPGELPAVLASVFGIVLSEEETGRLRDRLFSTAARQPG
jgi:N-hydroxyarylamine O-acetyltransferase